MKISVFGLGYVGCVSLGCLAKNGHHVVGVDVNELKVNLINEGTATIIDKDIDTIIKGQSEKNSISATSDHKFAVLNSDVTIICVGTPSTNNGHPYLDHIYQTANQIGEALKEKESFHVVVIRSTVLPGTNKKVGEIIEKVSEKKRNADYAVVSNPEFMREGTAVSDFFNPAVTVIGSDNEKAINILKEVYININAPIEETTPEIAELIKYVNNSFHALKISFANEIGNISRKIGIDSHELMELFCKDTQLNISRSYLKPGFAYGGSCLPKDLRALRTIAHDHYLKSPILDSIQRANENQKNIVFDMIAKKGKKKVCILGLAFKNGTDDLRYSPMVELAEKLIGNGYELLIYDENITLSAITGTNKEYVEKHIPHLIKMLSDDLNYVVSNSELIVISQDCDTFAHVVKVYPEKTLIDLVRIHNGISTGNYEGICW